MIRLFLASRSFFHVIAATETKLGDVIDDSLIELESYNLFRRDRNTRGGGVALFIHKSLSATVLCSSAGSWSGKPGLPEYLFCEIASTTCPPIFVGVVYRPPHAPFLAHSEFVPNLTTYMHNYSTKVILGDFNADLLSESDDAKFLRSLFEDNSLSIVPYGATHHTSTSNTWLDLCLVDSNDILTDCWKTDVPFIDGHDLITATLKSSLSKPVLKDFTYRDFKNVDKNGLIDFLKAVDCAICKGDDELEVRLNCLYKHLHEAVSLYVPLKTLKQCKGYYPWFTPVHRQLITERNRLYRRYKRSKLPADLQLYRQSRDKAHEVIETAKLLYFQDRLTKLTDSGQIWKELSNLGICTRSTGSSHPFSSDALNIYFAGVASDPFAPSVLDYIDSLPCDEDYFPVFTFTAVSLGEVESVIRLSTSQARGHDGIPQSIVLAALPILGPLLVNIYNDSIKNSIFPSIWKRSLVVALNKTSSPRTMGDIRPISLLCFLSKVLERIIHQQLYNYLDSRSLINDYQTGFRKGHSTQTALLKLSDDIRLGMDQRCVTMLLLFDFSKAFDTVCHVTLLRKLHEARLSNAAVRWFASYLSGREQAVIDNEGNHSTFISLNTGVPQGSVLGPLLFCIYINDISANFDSCVSHLIYADDLQLYVRFPLTELERYADLMSTYAEHVLHWATVNSLKLNVNKTKAMIIGSYFYINKLSDMATSGIVLNHTLIKFESCVRNLGVWFDHKLNWKAHVTSVCKKANSLLYRLNYFRKSTNFKLRKHLIETLLFPLVDYCSLVYLDISAELDLKLQRVINSGIRYIYGVRKSEHISPYRRSLGWMTTKGRRDYFTVSLLFKILRFKTPSYLYCMYQMAQPGRPTRGDVKPLTLPPSHSTFLDGSFHHTAIKLWNNIPAQYRNCNSLPLFKTLISSHYLSLESGLAPLLQSHL